MAVKKQSDAVRTQGGPAEVPGSQLVNGLQILRAGLLLQSPRGVGMTLEVNEEEITLDPQEATVSSVKKLFPQNSATLGVVGTVVEDVTRPVYAEGGITVEGAVTEGDTFAVGGQTFTFKLTRAGRGDIAGVSPTRATGWVRSPTVGLGETFTIGEQTFTFVPVRTAPGEVTGATSGNYAQGSIMLNFSVVPGITNNSASFVIGSQPFVFKTERTGVGEVTIGATLAETVANMKAAIDLDLAGVVTTEIVGVNEPGDKIIITAVAPGLDGILSFSISGAPLYTTAFGGTLGFTLVLNAVQIATNMQEAIDLDLAGTVTTALDAYGKVLLTAVAEGAPGELGLSATGLHAQVSGAALVFPDPLSTADVASAIITALTADLGSEQNPVLTAESSEQPNEVLLTSQTAGAPGILTFTGNPTNIVFTDFSLPDAGLLWGMADEGATVQLGSEISGEAETQFVSLEPFSNGMVFDEAASVVITTEEAPYSGKIAVTVFSLVFGVADPQV